MRISPISGTRYTLLAIILGPSALSATLLIMSLLGCVHQPTSVGPTAPETQVVSRVEIEKRGLGVLKVALAPMHFVEEGGYYSKSGNVSIRILELRNGRYRFWEQTNALYGFRQECSTSGRYAAKDSTVTLSVAEPLGRWTCVRLNGHITFWSPQALGAWRTNREIRFGDILLKTKYSAEDLLRGQGMGEELALQILLRHEIWIESVSAREPSFGPANAMQEGVYFLRGGYCNMTLDLRNGRYHYSRSDCMTLQHERAGSYTVQGPGVTLDDAGLYSRWTAGVVNGHPALFQPDILEKGELNVCGVLLRTGLAVEELEKEELWIYFGASLLSYGIPPP